MTSFNDFIEKYKIKNKATSNIEIQQVHDSIGLDNIGIYLKDGPFKFDISIVKIQPYRGTHWILYKNESFPDRYGCVCPKKLSKFIIKRNGYCFYSEYKIQGLTNERYSYCASFCLYRFYLTKVEGLTFKSAVLNLYYQRVF